MNDHHDEPENIDDLENKEETGEKLKAVVSDDLKNDLKEFCDIDQQLEDAKSAMKVLTERFNELKNTIGEFMINNDIPSIKFPNGSKIQVCPKNTKQSLNKEYLQTKLSAKYPDKKDVEEISDMVLKRPTTMSQTIKLTKKRAKE